MADSGGQFEKRMRELADVFAVRAFRLFSIGNFASLSAIWLVRFCIGWLTWELTHSKSWLGIMAFAEFGPSIFVSLYAGSLADRMDRLAILRMGQSAQAGLAVALFVLQLTGLLTVWWMLAILVGYSVMGGLNLPARLAAAPSLVGRERLATASAVGSITLNLTRLLGPLIAAPLLVVSMEWLAFLLAAGGFALNAFCLAMIRPEESAAASASAETKEAASSFMTVMTDMLRDAPLRYVLMIQFAVSLLVRPLNEMFPAFADQVFQRGEAGYAMLTVAVGIGAIVGAWFVVGETAGSAMRSHVLVGSAVFALSMMIVAMVGSFYLAALALMLFGAAMTASGIGGTTFVQSRTPIGRLGRVMSVYSVVYRLAPALGALGLGTLADVIGLRPAALLFPATALLAIAVCWRPLMKQA